MRNKKKIRAKRTKKYKSKLEANIARKLGKNAAYETVTISYLQPKKYKPDFVVPQGDRVVFIEVKGWFRYEDQQKMRAVKFSNPDLDIRMYFPVDGKVQGSKLKNSEWCIKHGFPFAIGKLPNSWRPMGRVEQDRRHVQKHKRPRAVSLDKEPDHSPEGNAPEHGSGGTTP